MCVLVGTGSRITAQRMGFGISVEGAEMDVSVGGGRYGDLCGR